MNDLSSIMRAECADASYPQGGLIVLGIGGGEVSLGASLFLEHFHHALAIFRRLGIGGGANEPVRYRCE